MPPAARSNPLALAVLVSLYERPMHPYEIAQTLRSRAKHESVRLNYGSLYGVVEGLERRAMVRAGPTMRDGRRPERTVYEITEAGTREACDWLAELLAVPAKEYPRFMAGLSFMCALAPEEVVEALRTRAKDLELRLLQGRALEGAAALEGLPRLFFLEAEYEQRLLEAELDFVRGLVADIESGSLDGLEMWRNFSQVDERVAPRPPSLTDAHEHPTPERKAPHERAHRS
ncbi:MAG: PadR family transcriptional regulator [Acidimicrobiales bacterium]